MTKISLMMLGVAGLFLSSGCASYRVLTNLKPEADPALQSPAGRFYIAGVKYTVGGDESVEGKKSADDIDAAYERKLLKLLRKECLSRYPLLFTKDSADSVPLWIKVDDSGASDDFVPVWMLCTVCICPIILPLPVDWERDIKVTVGRGTSLATFTNEMGQKQFHREEHGWMCFNPLGLISYPGESDFPKVSSAFNMGRYAYNDIPQVAQQVATATAKLISAKDPSFWTTQPRLNNSSMGLPIRTGEVPVAPSLPTDSVAPF
jgi:hypothetical protein